MAFFKRSASSKAPKPPSQKRRQKPASPRRWWHWTRLPWWLLAALLLLSALLVAALHWLPYSVWNRALPTAADGSRMVLRYGEGSLTQGKAWLVLEKDSKKANGEVVLQQSFLLPLAWQLQWNSLWQADLRWALSPDAWIANTALQTTNDSGNNASRLNPRSALLTLNRQGIELQNLQQLQIDAQTFLHLLSPKVGALGWSGHFLISSPQVRCAWQNLPQSCTGQGEVLWSQMSTALFNHTAYWGNYVLQWQWHNGVIQSQISSNHNAHIGMSGQLSLPLNNQQPSVTVRLQLSSDEGTINRLRLLFGNYSRSTDKAPNGKSQLMVSVP